MVQTHFAVEQRKYNYFPFLGAFFNTVIQYDFVWFLLLLREVVRSMI